MRCTPRRNRAMYLAAASFVSLGLAGGLAPLASGFAIEPLTSLAGCEIGPYTFTGYHVVFALSCVLRACGLPLVNRLREPNSGTMGQVIDSIRCTGLFGQRSPQR